MFLPEDTENEVYSGVFKRVFVSRKKLELRRSARRCLAPSEIDRIGETKVHKCKRRRKEAKFYVDFMLLDCFGTPLLTPTEQKPKKSRGSLAAVYCLLIHFGELSPGVRCEYQTNC